MSTESPRLVDLPGLAALLLVSPASIKRWRSSDPSFPGPIHLGERCLRWRLCDIDAWIAAHREGTGAVQHEEAARA